MRSCSLRLRRYFAQASWVCQNLSKEDLRTLSKFHQKIPSRSEGIKNVRRRRRECVHPHPLYGRRVYNWSLLKGTSTVYKYNINSLTDISLRKLQWEILHNFKDKVFQKLLSISHLAFRRIQNLGLHQSN